MRKECYHEKNNKSQAFSIDIGIDRDFFPNDNRLYSNLSIS